MGFWGTLVIAVASGIGAYYASYLREKGKNVATREDIADLTRIVEDIKTENSLLVERFKSQQQLRHAALDRRLEVHQQAYTLWRRLIGKVYAEDMGQYIGECERWWEENCLYLESEAREAFFMAYVAARGYRELVKKRIIAHDYKSIEMSAEAMSISFDRIIRAGDVIAHAVALPGLVEAEKKTVIKEMEVTTQIYE